MGMIDKGIRITIAIAIIVLYYFEVISGTLAITGLVIAAAFIITSFVSFCPLYLPFGISTRSKKKVNATH